MTKHRWQATDNHVRSIRCRDCGVHYNGDNYGELCGESHDREKRVRALKLSCTLTDDPCPIQTYEDAR